jgi:putative membrane protein
MRPAGGHDSATGDLRAACHHGGVPSHRPRLAGTLLGVALAAVVAGPVAAHGPVPPDPPSAWNLIFGWSFEPLVAIPLALAAIGWLLLVRRIDREHPDTRVPAGRTLAFLGGLITIAVALESGIERYDTTLFSIHMVQHLLLMLLAAPLLVLAAPVTQVLRAASPEVRQRWILPFLRSGPVVAVSHPLTAGVAFAGVLYATHFSPLYDLALENVAVHDVEHAMYLACALLFWWPVMGLDPAPHRMGYGARVLYLLIQMPLNSFLAVAILFDDQPLYHHYATLGSPYGIDALADQQLAAGIMWVVGNVAFVIAVLGVVAAWMRQEERDQPAMDRRADLERAAIAARADQLAARRAQSGSGEASSSR